MNLEIEWHRSWFTTQCNDIDTPQANSSEVISLQQLFNTEYGAGPGDFCGKTDLSHLSRQVNVIL